MKKIVYSILITLLAALTGGHALAIPSQSGCYVEELIFSVPKNQRQHFINIDKTYWTTFLEKQKGFLSKEYFYNDQKLLIRIKWKNEAAMSHAGMIAKKMNKQDNININDVKLIQSNSFRDQQCR